MRTVLRRAAWLILGLVLMLIAAVPWGWTVDALASAVILLVAWLRGTRSEPSGGRHARSLPIFISG